MVAVAVSTKYKYRIHCCFGKLQKQTKTKQKRRKREIKPGGKRKKVGLQKGKPHIPKPYRNHKGYRNGGTEAGSSSEGRRGGTKNW